MQTRERLCNNFTNAIPSECRFDSRAGCFLIDHISKLSQSGWVGPNKNNLIDRSTFEVIDGNDDDDDEKLTGQWSGGWQASLVNSKDISMTQRRQAHMAVSLHHDEDPKFKMVLMILGIIIWDCHVFL